MIANYGGLLYIEDHSTITFDDVTIKNSAANYNGGIVYAESDLSTTDTSSITFTNTATIDSVYSNLNGGAFYIDHSTINIYMNTVVTLTSSYAKSGKGGVFFIKAGMKLQIADS